ncbi:unnamed protein product [Tenebrio molitor]|nr:unnamed protein product [Tenebrio molitor]
MVFVDRHYRFLFRDNLFDKHISRSITSIMSSRFMSGVVLTILVLAFMFGCKADEKNTSTSYVHSSVSIVKCKSGYIAVRGSCLEQEQSSQTSSDESG